MRLRLNISPCPNDTFMFEGIATGRIDTEGLEFDIRFEDIERLNELAIACEPEITKISAAVLPEIISKYTVINAGAALGEGNGPLLVGRQKDRSPDNNWIVAVPGIHTTANLLMERIFPVVGNKTALLFSEIASAVAERRFDAGVLIHEGRFTYQKSGLELIADLGVEWERMFALPLPLGVIAVSKELPREIQAKTERVIRKSVWYAMESKIYNSEFVTSHAREMEPEVIERHIKLFVNDFSLDYGTAGREAVAKLTGLDEKDIFLR